MEEIESDFGYVNFYCDRKGCEGNHYYEVPLEKELNMKKAEKDAKAKGWIIFVKDNEYYHYCSEECKKAGDL